MVNKITVSNKTVSVYSVNGLDIFTTQGHVRKTLLISWCESDEGSCPCLIDPESGKTVMNDNYCAHYLWNSYAMTDEGYYSIIGTGTPYNSSFVRTNLENLETKEIIQDKELHCSLSVI